jgi:hypothetical protein
VNVVVFGLIGAYPTAGLVSHYLQYVLGLKQLGHRVLYLEDTGWYYDPPSNTYVNEWSDTRPPSAGIPARRIASVMRQYGLDDQWTWIDVDGSESGVSGSRLDRFLRDADLLVHVSGAGRMRDRYEQIPHRAYIDTDPGRIQMRVVEDALETDLRQLAAHTVHFSFGPNVGTSDCEIPTVGLQWHPTRQPLYSRLWPASKPARRDAPFTTLVAWSTYEPQQYRGKTYGTKNVEFLRFTDLPARAGHRFLLAMDGSPPEPEAELEARGWELTDGFRPSRNLRSYRRFIAESRGEWSMAKHGYVATNSGWFSERSVSYLAMARPVVVQSTAFETWLPTGEGVLSFSTLDEAVDAIATVDAAYDHHARRAREVAHDHFDARSVLAELVETATATRTADITSS